MVYDALLRLNCRRLRRLFDAVEDFNTRPLAARLGLVVVSRSKLLALSESF